MVDEDDVFICTVGFEERSRYLINMLKKIIRNENILVFFFEDLSNEIKIFGSFP